MLKQGTLESIKRKERTGTIEEALEALRQGRLIVLYDDMETESASLMGTAEHVCPDHVNFMIKRGQGLVSVCITEGLAKALELPAMSAENSGLRDRNFTISVDHQSTTTGISAFERADTIKAFTQKPRPEDFKRPGHIFPLVAKPKGLLEKVDIVEASTDLAQVASKHPVAYVCEILNARGALANEREWMSLAGRYRLPVVRISDLLWLRSDRIASFEGKVVKGRQVGRAIQFPTANLLVNEPGFRLEHGVYGVKVRHRGEDYQGIMNVGTRPTFHDEESRVQVEVHLFDFDRMIYGETLRVDAHFYVRKEIAFPNVRSLVEQIRRDVEYVRNRFDRKND